MSDAMTKTQEEKDALYLKLRNLRREMRERGIRRDIWGAVQDYAETHCRTVEQVDEWLDQMEANHNVVNAD